jgi:hypothetical protein
VQGINNFPIVLFPMAILFVLLVVFNVINTIYFMLFL